MYWGGASLLWSEIATQWDADFLVETLVAGDVCGIAVATTELQLSDSTILADLLSHIFVASSSVSETVGAASVESVVAKMLTGLNVWNDAYSLWEGRTHAWDIYLSSIAEAVAPFDAAGDLTEPIDYLVESVQFGDVVVLNCGAAVTLTEPFGADFNALVNAGITPTFAEVCATFGEFFDKSPRRKYEYDPRTDGIWRYYDSWSNDWTNDRCAGTGWSVALLHSRV